MHLYGGSNREESMYIKLKCDYEGNEDACNVMLNGNITAQKGDVVELSYKFTIGYFGDIVRRFQAIKSILENKGSVVECEIKELRRGQSLAYDLFKLIGETIERLEIIELTVAPNAEILRDKTN